MKWVELPKAFPLETDISTQSQDVPQAIPVLIRLVYGNYDIFNPICINLLL